MRKLIESTLVSLDGIIESPERWAMFDEDLRTSPSHEVEDRGPGGFRTSSQNLAQRPCSCALREKLGSIGCLFN